MTAVPELGASSRRTRSTTPWIAAAVSRAARAESRILHRRPHRQGKRQLSSKMSMAPEVLPMLYPDQAAATKIIVQNFLKKQAAPMWS